MHDDEYEFLFSHVYSSFLYIFVMYIPMIIYVFQPMKVGLSIIVDHSGRISKRPTVKDLVANKEVS